MRKLLWLLVFLLAACTTPPPKPTQPQVAEDPRALAYAAWNDGKWAEAAERFEKLAASAGPNAQGEYRLYAADAWLHAGDLARASHYLATVRRAALPPALAMRHQLVEAEIVLPRDPDRALGLLVQPAAAGAEAPLQARYHGVRARAFEELGKLVDAAREYIHRELFLPNPEEVKQNQQQLWQVLGRVPLPDLRAQRVQPPPDLFSGWVELALIARETTGKPADAATRVAAWRRDYPNHPAREELGTAQGAAPGQPTPGLPVGEVRPGHIAVLLPLSGQLASAGLALRDGILTAYFADLRTDRPQLQFHDTQGNPDRVLAAYQQAVQQGAAAVIGPLNKDEVRLLVQQNDLPVPVLALNYVEPPRNDDVFQFALAPEEEAEQLAQTAWDAGNRRALALTPAGAWGDRVLEAFANRWKALGGVLVDSTRYDPQENDYGDVVKSLLARAAAAAPAQNEPARRFEADFLFLGAFARQGRLIRPQLRYLHAGSLPVYSTSHVYNGTPDPKQDVDMDGIQFADMPWTLDAPTPFTAERHTSAPTLRQHKGDRQRLIAFGVDAYYLLPRLREMQTRPLDRYDGETGRLSLDPDRRVRRELMWARFRDGVPQLIGNVLDAVGGQPPTAPLPAAAPAPADAPR